MSVLQTLKALSAKRSDSLWISKEKQTSFLGRLPAPKDDLERSYLQYRCQAYLSGRFMTFLENCAALLLLPIYGRTLGRAAVPKGCSSQQYNGVLLYAATSAIVPDSLREEFHIRQVTDFQDHLCLTDEDWAYLRMLRRRYPFSFFFRFKCMVKVAMYSYILAQYAPKAVICSEEYSFTSSLLTDYCQRRGVEHINVMHGEKLYYIRDSFFHFHRCYVWDQHYIDLFSDLRADPAQFRKELPPSLRLQRPDTITTRVDYTYYLANEPRAQLETILKNLTVLRERGNTIAIRLHPRYFEYSKFLFEDDRGFLIENPSKLPLEESLFRTGHVVSLYSTVLLQAVSNSIPIVIDDLSDPVQYEKLQDMRFICLEKEHSLLSELLKEGGDGIYNVMHSKVPAYL